MDDSKRLFKARSSIKNLTEIIVPLEAALSDPITRASMDDPKAAERLANRLKPIKERLLSFYDVKEDSSDGG